MHFSNNKRHSSAKFNMQWTKYMHILTAQLTTKVCTAQLPLTLTVGKDFKISEQISKQTTNQAQIS